MLMVIFHNLQSGRRGDEALVDWWGVGDERLTREGWNDSYRSWDVPLWRVLFFLFCNFLN